ncbi:MAG: deoxyribose-phosphate aldolase [Beutenbergiaceae bacterium]
MSKLDSRPGHDLAGAQWQALRQARYTDPEAFQQCLPGRRRRPLLTGDQRLLIVAADHPARGALDVGGQPMAMASRRELLQRLCTALARPGVDGVLGTPDILEDLAWLGALDGKLAFGSMNRGGLRGSVFEIDDRYTAYDVQSLLAAQLDAGKLLVRIDLADGASASTIEASAAAITAAAQARLPIVLEPFMSTRVDGDIRNHLCPEAVMTAVAIASGLGASSAYSWLKLPVVPQMERILDSTTLPTLLLGGDTGDNQEAMFTTWESALALPGVRGLVVGRRLLYPADDDVPGAVDVAARLVHGGLST